MKGVLHSLTMSYRDSVAGRRPRSTSPVVAQQLLEQLIGYLSTSLENLEGRKNIRNRN